MIEVQGRYVTFTPPSGAAYLMGDFTDWDEAPLPTTRPMTIEFPQGAYVEYAFLDANQQPMADSTNPQKPKNPWYDYHRSVTLPHNTFEAPPRPHTFRGKVSGHSIDSYVFERQRAYYVYEPPTPSVATLYVQDGEAFYHKLQLHEVVDALLEQEVIRPICLVLLEPHARTSEYWFNERYEAFLLEEMLPTVERFYGVTPERGLWGASLGGLVSAWLAWRNPHLFTKVATQSGCFTADPQGSNYYHDPEWLTQQFAASARRPLRLYVETGQIEWLLAPNRRFAAMLADKGYPHSYQERPSGHNWATWEQGLVSGLTYLFGM
ncbi:MAG: esterase family protein [Ktedonobacteraceae bacterium]|nr:esterase family protein [Ktedonobacteraceae bacterium]